MVSEKLRSEDDPATMGASRSAEEAGEFARQAVGDNAGLIAEFWAFLRENKKWWLIPLIGSLLLIGLLSLLASSGAAPFIYTLF